MNHKRIWLMLPAAIMPYLMAALPLFIFFSTRVPLFERIVQDVFDNNILWIVLAFFLFAITALGLSALCFKLSLKHQWDPHSLAKTAVILKIIQIPGYIAVYVLGAAFLITIFTFVITLLYVLFDFLTLLMTGQLVAAAAINLSRKGQLPLEKSCWYIALQVVFCADVVGAILFYRRLRKNANISSV